MKSNNFIPISNLPILTRTNFRPIIQDILIKPLFPNFSVCSLIFIVLIIFNLNIIKHNNIHNEHFCLLRLTIRPTWLVNFFSGFDFLSSLDLRHYSSESKYTKPVQRNLNSMAYFKVTNHIVASKDQIFGLRALGI